MDLNGHELHETLSFEGGQNQIVATFGSERAPPNRYVEKLGKNLFQRDGDFKTQCLCAQICCARFCGTEQECGGELRRPLIRVPRRGHPFFEACGLPGLVVRIKSLRLDGGTPIVPYDKENEFQMRAFWAPYIMFNQVDSLKLTLSSSLGKRGVLT